MNGTREGAWRLRWGAILAGAAVTTGAAWLGDLLGSLLALIEPGEGSAWAWLGGLVGLGAVLAGALAGGYIAGRAAGVRERMDGMLHGVVVWGLFGTASALLFAILGGNLALIAGATAGAIRLAVGFAMLGLLGALLAAAAGGAAAAGARPGLSTRRQRRQGAPVAEEAPRTARVVTPPRAQGPEVYTRPEDRGDVPPSVH